MTPQEARALAMAHELYALLGEIFDRPEHGVGTCVEAAWDKVDEVIWLLDPDAPSLTARKSLRLSLIPHARPY
jgi:hypothetical protein